jgi:histidinol dehydrogenase
MISIYKDAPYALKLIQQRAQFSESQVTNAVMEIIQTVKTKRDQALFEYTKRFDQVELNSLQVTETEIKAAYDRVSPVLKSDLLTAYNNIKNYHDKQRFESFSLKPSEDITLRQLVRPIENVGIYVPGGTAAYPSTVLMNAVPAKLAGVKNLIMITPPDKNGQVKDILLAAAYIAGVNQIYKVGGAQGIAGLAYGTETLPKVDKIVGPGNAYVAMAKRLVMGDVGIDMIAGPSEIAIIADDKANPAFIAADLMSQAEHDTSAQAILITTSMDLAIQVQIELSTQIQSLLRKDIIQASLISQGAIILVDTLKQAFDVSNQIAPEHLELLMDNPESYLDWIQNAGSVFLGPYTPEPIGDYVAGPNHTLPTSGTARFSSGLSTYDFMKRTSVSSYGLNALKNVKDTVIRLANEEGLTAHAAAVQIRFKE